MLPLDIIDHEFAYGPTQKLDPAIFRHIRCTKQGCIRCAEGRGGFQFRWVAKEWLAAYIYNVEATYGPTGGPAWHREAAAKAREKASGV